MSSSSTTSTVSPRCTVPGLGRVPREGALAGWMRAAHLAPPQAWRDPRALPSSWSAWLRLVVAEAWLAAAWYGFPSRELVMIGVTGTDGKTTTANLLFGILRQAGLRAGMLSPIKAAIGDQAEPLALHVTTQEAPVVQAYLSESGFLSGGTEPSSQELIPNGRRVIRISLHSLNDMVRYAAVFQRAGIPGRIHHQQVVAEYAG